ncbi:YopX family protein [Kineothrix sedimenti]|uniref:YopX family protein n=1 Tax=Kineothrix sedimenti TaxID=3123317 RepID=A0ABZ3ETI8_9FIRM
MEDRYLYKAKRVDNGQWMVGCYIRYGSAGDEKDYIVPQSASALYAIKIDPATLCQCTGLKDKNDKLIWENDIVEAWSEGVRARGTVKRRVDGLWLMYPAWQKGISWGLCPNDTGKTTVVRLGNKIDNPELLEV